jgi:acylphosphatase
MDRLHLVVRGHVQGVGFRWFVTREAELLGLAGAVWNRRDGAVELDAEGPRERLETLRDSVRAGPRAARVTSVDETWSEGPARYVDFQIAPPR